MTTSTLKSALSRLTLGLLLAFTPAPALAQAILVENAPPARLAFVTGNDLIMLEAGSREARRVSSKTWISPSSPRFLDSTGDTLLFSAHKRERFGPERGEINIDKSDLFFMTDTDNFIPLTDAGDLSIAPDAVRGGKDIVFVANRHARLRALMPRTSTMELYLISTPWKMPERLTHDGGSKYNPRWSPDGARVAYLWLNKDSTGIYVLDVAKKDTMPRRISSSGDYPTWSPDGTSIAFASRGKLYSVVADGEGPQPKLLMAKDYRGYASFPRWTRHGILFQWARDTKQGLALLDPGSGRISVLVSGEGEFGGADLADQ
ncbi:MAG: hypothetical protein AAB229_07955 [Candidatus Hydrogenedentota bacterium]